MRKGKSESKTLFLSRLKHELLKKTTLLYSVSFRTIIYFILEYVRLLHCKKNKTKSRKRFLTCWYPFYDIYTLFSTNKVSILYFFHKIINNSSNIEFFIRAPLGVTFCKLFLSLLSDQLKRSEWIDVITN